MSKEIKIALIGAIATILAAIIGGIFLLNSQSANQHNASSTSPSVPITSATTQSTPFATTSTPSPTPTMITITKNLQIPCAQCEYPVGLELLSIDINGNDNTSVFHFKATNNYSSALTEIFSQLSLQDDKGITSNAGGVDGNGYDIGPGNSVIVMAIFPFAPKPGVNYTLSVALGGTGSAIYKDQSITVS